MIKYSSETYLKGVKKYSLNLFVDSNVSYYIVVKKIIEMDDPFILNEYGEDVIILDNGYYILEYIPKEENYICRIFIDNNRKIIEKIFLVTGRNYIYNGIPVYDDLKLSFICVKNRWKVYNYDLFKKLYGNNEVAEDIYKLFSNKFKLNDVKNIVLPFDYKKYLD